MEIILRYFPDLPDDQQAKLQQLDKLYRDWNEKINLISRKEIDLLYERHILHSLAIAKVIQFQPLARVLDLGTGGGFPGIPLAILFPETEFLLVDSIGKKIKVVEAVAEALQLRNVRAQHIRAEELKEDFDFVVSRAVAPLGDLVEWTKKLFIPHYNHDLKNGIICLKGGDLKDELKQAGKRKRKVYDLKDFFEEPFFETKKIVYVQMIY